MLQAKYLRIINNMKIVKPFKKQLYDFFFQSKEDYAKELELCNNAQRRYYMLLGNIRQHKVKRQLRYR